MKEAPFGTKERKVRFARTHPSLARFVPHVALQQSENIAVVQVRQDSASPSLISMQVRAARALLGWTQAKLAARSGVAERSIASIEAGRRIPRGDTLERLATVFADAGIAMEHSNGRVAVSKILTEGESAAPTVR